MKEILEKMKEARFTTTDELYSKKDEIREVVQKYDNDTLEIYKWYFFYQLCLLKNPLKELLWNYLIKDKISIMEKANLSIEYQKYKERCRQILQYQKKKDEENNKKEEIDKIKKITINGVEDLFKI
jgi:hypothetical protein